MLQETDTVLARVLCESPSVVEVHIKPDVRITVEAFGEVMQVRRSLMKGGKGAILFVAPGELEWETAVLRTDHFNDDRENLTAVAVMVDSRVLNTVVNTYFTLFPPEFPMKVFDSVEAAKEWLREPAV
ncbi:MAG: STAS/SEC14 domain-containing protein [Flavobacteriales bacterium]|nr:STAS/SEC14 domain-containing protein [Flavobacteriales bacterium]